MSFSSHLLTQAAKPKTPSNPKLAWMMLAGSGIAAVKEKFASAWNWKSVPFTPLIVPILGVMFGAAPPGKAGKERRRDHLLERRDERRVESDLAQGCLEKCGIEVSHVRREHRRAGAGDGGDARVMIGDETGRTAS